MFAGYEGPGALKLGRGAMSAENMASSASVHRSAYCCDPWIRCPALSQRRRSRRAEAVAEAGEERRSSTGGVMLWSVLCPALLKRRRPSQFEVRAEAGEERKSSGGGERLWRSELSSSSWSDESFFRRSKEAQEEEEQAQMSRKHINDEQGGVGVMEVVASLVEKFLVADFFFILFILAWFMAGLAEMAAFDTSSLIDVWLLLWPRLFQPALGFFLAGSLWTALSKIWRKR